MDHPTSERVYSLLKTDILHGRGGGAGRLNITFLARRWGTSVTPVREALMRLVGETLVVVDQPGGFKLAPTTPYALAQSYALNFAILSAALRPLRERNSRVIKPDHRHLIIDAAHLFEAVAGDTGNDAFVSAIQAMNDRLNLARLAEAATLAHVDAEFVTLLRAYTGTGGGFNRRLRSYHLRRLRNSAAISANVMAIAAAAD